MESENQDGRGAGGVLESVGLVSCLLPVCLEGQADPQSQRRGEGSDMKKDYRMSRKTSE